MRSLETALSAECEKQIIHQRNQSLRQIELKYVNYIHSLLLQKLLITENIRQKYDQLIKQVHNLSNHNPHNEQSIAPNSTSPQISHTYAHSLSTYSDSDNDNDDVPSEFISHMSLSQAQNLSIDDQIDHRDLVGCSIGARIVDKNGSNLKIHYENWSDEWDVWSDYTQELYKYALYNSISSRPRHRLFNLTAGSMIDINPNRHKGWKIGKIVQVDQDAGQIQTSYQINTNNTHYFWTHIDNEEELAKLHTFTEKKYQCMHCSNVYKSCKELRVHAKVDHADRPYLCPFCPWTSIKKGHLKNHVFQHNNNHPFKCDICASLYQCNTAYKQQSSLTSHLMRVHKCKKKDASAIQVSGRKRKRSLSPCSAKKKMKIKWTNEKTKQQVKEQVMNGKIWKLWMWQKERITKDNVDKTGTEITRMFKAELKECIMGNKLCDEWKSAWNEYTFVRLEQKVFFDLCAARADANTIENRQSYNVKYNDWRT